MFRTTVVQNTYRISTFLFFCFYLQFILVIYFFNCFSIFDLKAILIFLILLSFFFFLQIEKRIHINLIKWQFHPTTSHYFYLLFWEKMFL